MQQNLTAPQRGSLASRPPDGRPWMVYDGDCGFCRQWIARWHRLTGERIHYEPYQQVAGSFPQIPRESFERAVHLIEADGRVSSGAYAVFRSLALARRTAWLAWLYQWLPGFSLAAEGVYRFVARHRKGLAKVDRFVPGLLIGWSMLCLAWRL